MKLLCWDTGLQEAPFYNWEGCVLRPWHLHRTYCCRNHFFGLHFLATQWRLVFGAAAAVGSRLGMPSGYACPCCAFRGLRPWNSYAGTLALQEAAFYNWEGWMLRPWPVRSMCCCRNHFLLFFIFFGHVMATAKIQPQEMTATKKYSGTRNENVGFRAGKLVSRACVPLSGRSRPPNKPATGNENLGLGLAKLF